MDKRIQINMSTFLDVYRLIYSLDLNNMDLSTIEIINRLETALNAKIDAMQKHETYTQSKIASSSEERELARQKYLDLAGIHKDWRYSSEYNKE